MLVKEDDLSGQQSRDLIALHLARMAAHVPPGAIFLGLSELQSPDVTVWTAWEGSDITGIGALKTMSDGIGEIKSMRTHPKYVGRGVGRQILQTMIDTASKRGISRLSLETGSGSPFEAAKALYESFGFREGEPYASYAKTAFNHFLHLDLA